MITKPTAILWDLDGVLVDAVELHERAFIEALDAFGWTLTEENHRLHFDGLPTRVKLEKMNIPEEQRPGIAKEKQRRTLELIEQYIGPEEEKQRMLRLVRGVGIKTACCSNALPASVEEMLRRAGLLPLFDLVLGSTSVRKPKPDPAIYLKAMRDLGVKPEECVIFEDSEVGLKAAKRSGAQYFRVEYKNVNCSLIRRFL